MGKKLESKYDDSKYLKEIGASEEFYKKSNKALPVIEIGSIGIAGAVGMMAAARLMKNKEPVEKESGTNSYAKDNQAAIKKLKD